MKSHVPSSLAQNFSKSTTILVNFMNTELKKYMFRRIFGVTLAQYQKKNIG